MSQLVQLRAQPAPSFNARAQAEQPPVIQAPSFGKTSFGMTLLATQFLIPSPFGKIFSDVSQILFSSHFVKLDYLPFLKPLEVEW